MQLPIDDLSKESLIKAAEMMAEGIPDKSAFGSIAEMFLGKMVGIYLIQEHRENEQEFRITERANRDFHCGEVYNGYPSNTKEQLWYQAEISRLAELEL